MSEGFRGSLIQEQELFLDLDREKEEEGKKRHDYDEIHLSGRQREIVKKLGGKEGEKLGERKKDIDYYMRDKISEQEKTLIY